MLTQYFLVFALFGQIYAHVPYDIRNDTYTELGNLRGTVLGTILAADSTLDSLDINFRVDTLTRFQEGLVDIQSDSERVHSELNNIKNLALSVNVNISSCLHGREDYLNDLPVLVRDDMWTCIQGELDEKDRVINASAYLIDVTINRVNALEFQLNLCEVDDAQCYSALSDQIALETVKIPLNIQVQLEKAATMLGDLIVEVEECASEKTALFVSAADIILNSITQCVNGIIG